MNDAILILAIAIAVGLAMVAAALKNIADAMRASKTHNVNWDPQVTIDGPARPADARKGAE